MLDGKLRDIRRSESRNAVALRFDGNDGLLQDPELVMNVHQQGDEFEVLLVEGVSPQTLLKRLVESNTVVTKFEMVEPTLHDIFIAKVKENA